LKIDKIKPDVFFILVAAIFGFIWIFLTPPFQVPDEIDHFTRSLEIADGQVFPGPLARQGGGYLPENLDALVECLDAKKLRWESNIRQDVDKLSLAGEIPFGEKVFKKYQISTWIYPPVLYFPQAAGALIATKAGLNILPGFYLSRVFNFACWLFLTFLAIRVTPFFKWGFAILGLIPMNLFMAASVNPDATINGVGFLWTAVIFRCAYLPEVKRVDIKTAALFVLAGAFLTLSKSAYLPMILMLLLIPSEKFEGKFKKYISFTILAALCVSLLFLWRHVTSDLYVWGLVKVNDKISAVSKYPLLFSKNSIAAIFRNLFGIVYIPGVLGWLDTVLNNGLRYLYYPLLLLVFVFGYEMKDAPRIYFTDRLVLVLSFLFSSVIFCFFNSKELPVVSGMQGRYFIPLGICFFSIFFINRANRVWNELEIKSIKILIVGVCIYGLLSSTSRITARYYGF
jgi:uncharacterized membrane protein